MKYKTENITLIMDDIRPNTWNPNKMDKATFEAEKESLMAYGMVSPIIVRKCLDEEGYEIIDGEHRYTIWYEMGNKEIPCVLVHGLSDKDAKKLTIILNETKGNPNKIELGKLLQDLKLDFGDDLKLGLPFSDDYMKDLMDFGEIDWDKYENQDKVIEDDDILRLHLTFKGEDIALIKDKLSDNAEEKIIDLLKA